MRNQSLNDKIIALLQLSDSPMTMGQIQDVLTVDASEISSRLVKLVQRGDLVVILIDRPANIITGPKKIKAYKPRQQELLSNDSSYHLLNIFKILPQT